MFNIEKKVNATTSETIGISGDTNKYRGKDAVSLRRKTDPHISTMSGGLLSTQSFNVKFDKVIWSAFVNGPSCIARENSISFFPGRANIKSEKAGKLPGMCYSWELSQTRTSLVSRGHKAIQCQKNPTAGTSDDHPNRCCFFFSIHTRINSHFKAWSYKKRKHKKIKAYRKSF